MRTFFTLSATMQAFFDSKKDELNMSDGDVIKSLLGSHPEFVAYKKAAATVVKNTKEPSPELKPEIVNGHAVEVCAACGERSWHYTTIKWACWNCGAGKGAPA